MQSFFWILSTSAMQSDKVSVGGVCVRVHMGDGVCTCIYMHACVLIMYTCMYVHERERRVLRSPFIVLYVDVLIL